MPAIPIEIGAEDDVELRTFLSQKIYEFNVNATGIADGELLTATIRDADGSIIAALSGHTWGDCCEIEQLWVHEQRRQQGIGKAMFDACEREALNRGCTQIVLSTHSFQAPGFYEKFGFQRLAAVPNYPRGHENVLYIKYLEGVRK